jgi:hypothetical protein
LDKFKYEYNGYSSLKLFEDYITHNFYLYIRSNLNNYMININENDNKNELMTENDEYKTNRNKLNNSINKENTVIFSLNSSLDSLNNLNSFKNNFEYGTLS